MCPYTNLTNRTPSPKIIRNILYSLWFYVVVIVCGGNCMRRWLYMMVIVCGGGSVFNLGVSNDYVEKQKNYINLFPPPRVFMSLSNDSTSSKSSKSLELFTRSSIPVWSNISTNRPPITVSDTRLGIRYCKSLSMKCCMSWFDGPCFFQLFDVKFI